MMIVLFILTLPSIKLFNAVTGIGISTAFSSPIFLGSFSIMFVILSIYDFIISRKVWILENIIADMLVFVLLVSLVFNYMFILMFFILILFGLLFGALLRNVIFKQKSITKEIVGSIAFLFIIWIIYVILANTNYYAAPTSNTINFNKPYLTQQQLQNIYGSGIYSESTLNAKELSIGALNLLFPTPIQTLLFNFTFQNSNVGASYYIIYYNNTYRTNFTELLVMTPQASIILATQAPHAKSLGSLGNLQYIDNLTVNPNSFIALVQRSNFLAIISCSGSLCTNQAFNTILQRIGIGID